MLTGPRHVYGGDDPANAASHHLFWSCREVNVNLQDCPDKATLFAYANGELPSGSNTEVSRHVEECTQCRTVVESINLSELATLGPQSELEAVKSPAESPQSMQINSNSNRICAADQSMGPASAPFSDSN